MTELERLKTDILQIHGKMQQIREELQAREREELVSPSEAGALSQLSNEVACLHDTLSAEVGEIEEQVAVHSLVSSQASTPAGSPLHFLVPSQSSSPIGSPLQSPRSASPFKSATPPQSPAAVVPTTPTQPAVVHTPIPTAPTTTIIKKHLQDAKPLSSVMAPLISALASNVLATVATTATPSAPSIKVGQAS